MELSEQIGSDTNETSDRTLIVQSSSTCVENSNCGFDGDKNNNAELSSSFTSIRKSIDRSKSSDSSDNTALNFSVDRILKSSSSKTDTNLDDSKKINFETNLLRNAVPDDDFGKLYRPMPVRYMPNSTPFAGYPLNSTSVSLQRCHLKYPFSHYYHHVAPIRPITNINFGVEKILSPNAFAFQHFQNSQYRTDCLVDPTNPKITSIPPPSAASISNSSSNLQHTKRKRSWSRAVFSQLQRKGLEIQFQIQKYITKPDRRKLAARLGLTDAQVKVWFQNRRMKWRHTRETKLEKTRNNSNREKNKTDTKDDSERDYMDASSMESDSYTSSDDDKSEIDVLNC